MNPTLKDIANECGFAVSTISMVLNDRRDVSIPATTRHTVLTAAQKLGYQVKSKQRAAKSIVVLTFEDLRECFENPYFAEIYSGVEEAISEQGGHIVFKRLVGENYPADLGIISSGQVDGVLLLGDAPESLLDSLKQINARVVCVNAKGKPEWDTVGGDSLETFKIVFQKFIEAGHERFFCLKTRSRPHPDNLSYQDIQDAMAILKIADDRLEVVWTDGDTAEDGYRATNKYLEQHSTLPFTAAFSGLAKPFGMVEALQERGFSIPRDVSVLLVGGASTMPASVPKLSGVYCPLKEMGREGVYRLIQQVRGETSSPCRTLLPVHYIDHGSVVAPRGK